MAELSFTNFIKNLYAYRARFVYIFITLLFVGQAYTILKGQNSTIEYNMKIRTANTFTTEMFQDESKILSELIDLSIININPDPKVTYNSFQDYYLLKSSEDLRSKLRQSLQSEYELFLKKKKRIYQDIVENHPGVDRYSEKTLDSNQLSLLYAETGKLTVHFSDVKSSHPKYLKFILISFLMSILLFILSVIFSEIKRVVD